MKNTLLNSVAGFAVILSTSAFAQDAQVNDSSDENDNSETTRLQRIVKGSGVDKVAVDTPQAVTVVNQEDLENAQPTTVGDIFKQIPGANTSGSERVLGESFNIRGVGSGEDQADEGRFIINVDGVDKNYQQYRMGGFFSDPELYKRVEVLRGPASSTLYGSGALAGTVLFATKDASDFLEDGETAAVRFKSTYESNIQGLLKSVIVAFKPRENVEFLASGNYRFGGDYETGNDTLIDADFMSKSGLLKGTITFGENNEQSLRATYQKWNTDAVNQQYAQTVNSPDFGRVDRNITDETYILAYENPATDNDWIDFKAQISYSETLNQERNATVFFFGPGPGTQFFPDADFRYATWQAKAQNTVRTEGANWENFFTFGGQYTELTRSLSKRDSGTQPAGVDEKYGIFAQSEFIHNEKLTLIPGIRVDYRTITPDQSVLNGFATNTSSVNDVAISPKIAALYKFNDSLNIFGSFAHTERLPTIDEVYDYRTGAVFGQNLKLEKSNNIEGGFGLTGYDVFSDNDVFQVKTTAFHNRIDDFIHRSLVATTAPGPGPAFVNIGDVRLYGIEVEGAYEADNMFATFGASAIRGEDIGNSISSSGNLGTVTADELFLTVGGKIPDQGIRYGWKSRFVASQNDVIANPPGGRFSSNAFSTHDLFFNWVPQDAGLKGLEFRASVENLFDTQYQEFLANDPAKGRTFKISLVKKFSK